MYQTLEKNSFIAVATLSLFRQQQNHLKLPSSNLMQISAPVQVHPPLYQASRAYMHMGALSNCVKYLTSVMRGITILSDCILFSEEVYPIEFPADNFPICIFDHPSFIFCEAGEGQLRLSVIYDISSHQGMKNKLDFS